MPEVLQGCGGGDEGERPSSLLLLRFSDWGEVGGVCESLFTEVYILRAILLSFLETNQFILVRKISFKI